MNVVKEESCRIHGAYLEWDNSPVPVPKKNGVLITRCPGCWMQVATTRTERDDRKYLYDEAVTTLVRETKNERRSAQISITSEETLKFCASHTDLLN